MQNNQLITISLVSHNHMALIKTLLNELQKFCSDNIAIILTINTPEEILFHNEQYTFPIKLIFNEKPKGFAENHNTAFKYCKSPYFCVMNPDIHLIANPFEHLVSSLADKRAGVVAPLVKDRKGVLQDNARKFPSPLTILRRILSSKGSLDYVIENQIVKPDWVAGMFMLFRQTAFETIGGFDKRYFLYCEDMDICAKLRLSGYEIMLNPRVTVIHDAQRTSHKELNYLKWHITSLLKFFYKRYFLRFSKKNGNFYQDEL